VSPSTRLWYSPFLLQGILDLEEIGEVAVGGDVDVQIDGLGVMVEDGERLAEPAADAALPDHRELRVDYTVPVPGTRKNRVSK
jgi:hypothetical protein